MCKLLKGLMRYKCATQRKPNSSTLVRFKKIIMRILTSILFLLFLSVNNLYAQDYKKIHYKAILVDTHNDIISTCVEYGFSFDQDLKGKTYSDLQRMKEAGVDVQVFSIWCDGERKNPFAFANREIDSLYAWYNRNPDKMMLVKTPKELTQAVKQHKLASMLGVEGGHMIEN